MTSRAAVLFDRDGTLTEDRGYTFKPDDLRWMPGAIDALAALNRRGVLAIVVTNQSGVARGYFDEAAVNAFHDRMQAELRRADARIDAFYHCPFHADAITDAYRHPDHPDRKPNPGMVRRAITEFQIDVARAILVGDLDNDLIAAERAGVRGVLYAGGDLSALIARETAGFS